MKFYLYLLFGALSGLLGGMGMGGGTVLIPALTIFSGVEQHVAQAANLVAFLPMAAFSLSVHAKRGLLKTEGFLSLAIPACIFSAAAGFAAAYLQSEVLKKFFGVFLIFLAVKGALSGVLKVSSRAKR